MALLRIYVPCAVLPVRVRLGYGFGGLSPLEASLLRVAIGLSAARAGDKSEAEPVPLRDLIKVLGLGATMTTHLVADLWRQGHVVLDMYEELVTPVAETVRAHKAGQLAGLASGESALDVVEVLQEYVTGRVVGSVGTASPADVRLALPRSGLFAPSNDDISPSALLAAVASVIDQSVSDPSDDAKVAVEGRQRRPRVREAHLDRSTTALPAIRWLSLEVAIRRDLDSGRLRVEVRDRRLDAAARQLAGERISQYLEEQPESTFAQHVRNQIGTTTAAAPTPERLLERLHRQLAAARTAVPGTRQAQHGRLQDLAEQLRWQLADRSAAEMAVQTIGTGAEYATAVRELVANARHQVVFATPVVATGVLGDLLDLLEAAVRRGVQLVFVWGSRRQKTLDVKAVRMLRSLHRLAEATPGAGDVVWPVRPAGSAACVVLADRQEALVGGCPPLGSHSRGELALRITAPAPADCRPMDQLLAWARRTMPDSSMSRSVLFRASDFADPAPSAVPDGDTVDPAEHADGAADRVYPSEPPDRDGADEAPAMLAWVDAWAAVVDGLHAEIDRKRPPAVRVVTDGAHRDLFWDGLREAHTRIAIGAADVAGQIVDDRLLGILGRRLDAGVPLRVIHRRGQVDDHGRDGHALLRALASGRPDGLCLIDRAQSNGRAVVADDTAVVGSFDFLSHEGYFTQGGGRPDHELGLLVDDRAVADAVANALGAVTVEQRPHPAVAWQGPAASGRGAAAAYGLINALAAVPAAETERRAELVRTAVDDTGPDLLDGLSTAGVTDEVVRVAAAWWLTGVWPGGGPTAHRWTAWLLREAWRRGDVAGCWVLRRAVDAVGIGAAVDAVPPEQGGAHNPHAMIIRLAAGLAAADAGDELQLMALTDGLAPPMMETLVLAAAAEALTGPAEVKRTTAMVDVLEFLEQQPAVRRPWRTLARLLVDQDPGTFPVPVDELRDHRDRQERRRRWSEGWAAVEAAFASVSSAQFVFEAGIKTHSHLFHPSGTFGVAENMIRKQDLAGLRLWIRSSELRDLGSLVDRISDELTQNHSRIDGKPRRGYLTKLASVVTAVRRLTRLPEPPENEEQVEKALAAARPVATKMADVWPDLRTDLAALSSPERELCDEMLDRLAPIVEWGRTTDA